MDSADLTACSVDKRLKAAGPVALLMILQEVSTLQARESLLKIAYNKASQQHLAQAMGIGAALEFVGGPFIGKISDKYGRKPVMMLCALATTISRLWVTISPTSKAALLQDKVIGTVALSSFFNALRASQADASSSASLLSLHSTRLARYAALGLFSGPYMYGLMRPLTGRATDRVVFALSSLLAFAVATLVSTELQETSPRNGPSVELGVADLNPLRLSRVIGDNKTLTTIFAVLFLQSFGDPRNLRELLTLFLRDSFGWGPVRTTNTIAALVVTSMTGAFFAKKGIFELGVRGQLAASNLSQVLSACLWVVASVAKDTSGIITSGAVLSSCGASARRDVMEALAMRSCDLNQARCGHGEVAALLSTWRAVGVLLVPLLLRSVAGSSTGSTAGASSYTRALAVVAMASFLAERLMNQMSDEELGLSKEDAPGFHAPLSTHLKVKPPTWPAQVRKVKHSLEGKHIQLREYLCANHVGEKRELTPFLKPNTRQAVVLLDKFVLSHDTLLLRFSLPNDSFSLGLPVGKHVKFWCPHPGASSSSPGMWNGETDREASKTEIERKYSPCSSSHDQGTFDVAVKVYSKDPSTKFVDGGKMSQFLSSLKVGAQVDVAGPFGRIEYKGKGEFTVGKKTHRFRKVGLIAGGSGITPFLPLIRACLEDLQDDTQLSLLYANRSEEDILFKESLDELANRFPHRFRASYTVTAPSRTWDQFVGYVDKKMLKESMPPVRSDSAIFLCGPPAMIEQTRKKVLGEIGFASKSVFEF